MRSIRTTALTSLLGLALMAGCGASYAPEHPSTYAGDSAGAPPPVAEAAPEMEAEEQALAPAQPSPLAQAAGRAVAKRVDAAPDQPQVAVAPHEPSGTEQYTDHGVNPFVDPAVDPLSTFAIDVDTGSYAIARSKLTSNTLPPFAAVRAEEFLNYFDYGYAAPTSAPFAVHLDAAPSPFTKGHHLLRVAIQAKRVSGAERTPVHLVYLVDTSGSMHSEDKLGLAKKSLKLLTSRLRPGDTVALCTYAGSTRIVLPPTGANERATILRAIDDLSAGGGTAMSSGIEMAYELAQRTLVKGHVNRVIVLSDGDANIGRTSHQQILERIGHFKNQGITLSTVGFGRGNYKDTMMEQLANKGDGNYSYIDTEAEARRVFSDQLDGLLQVVARDVKVQVELDPRVVERYRLIGYENRDIADKDFRNDAVDAGEIGAGHNVTALYDLVLKEQPAPGRSPVVVRLRYKAPEGSERASELSFTLSRIAERFDDAPANLRFAAAVAGFAEILRKSPHARGWSLAQVERIASRASWGQPEQAELVDLVRRAARLGGERPNGGGALMAK